MNGMLNEKMFGPIEVPILKGVGRREITTFLAQYERYEAVRDSRALVGVELQLIPEVNCVEPHLLIPSPYMKWIWIQKETWTMRN